MKCDNCSRDAVYMIDRGTVNTIYLCANDLPAHMRAEATTGAFNFPEEPTIKKTKKSVEAPVEEPQPETPVEPQPEVAVESN